MIYQVTYTDENGNPVQQATFNAPGPKDAFLVIMTTPSLQPPPGAVDVEIRRLPDDA